MYTPADTVTVRIPRQDTFLSLLRMVLGGIASRRDLSFDALDDLLLVVDTITAEDHTPEELSMSVTIGDRGIAVSLEPLTDADLLATLQLGRVPAEAEGRCIDVCLLLESLVDSYRVDESGGGRFSVTVEKAIV